MKKGEKVKAVVLGVEPQNRRLSLGIKQLQPDVWESFFAAASRRRRGSRQGSAHRAVRRIRRNCRGRRGPLPHLRSRRRVDGHSTLETGVWSTTSRSSRSTSKRRRWASACARSATKPAAPRSSTTRPNTHKQPVSSSTTTLGDLINWRRASANRSCTTQTTERPPARVAVLRCEHPTRLLASSASEIDGRTSCGFIGCGV